jgi:hypothetical protein
MARTTVKGIRLTAQEVRRAGRLRAFFPEAGEEADFNKLVYLRGLVLLEAEVAGAGGGLPPGQTEESLSTIILPRILSVLGLLGRVGKLPQVYPLVPPTERTETAGANEGELTIDPSAADDVAGLGGGDFL